MHTQFLAQQTMREHVMLGGRVFADMIANLSKSESRQSCRPPSFASARPEDLHSRATVGPAIIIP
jgi:hypothetical protein